MNASNAASLTDPALTHARSHSLIEIPPNGSLNAIGLPPLVTHIERHKLDAELVVSSGDAVKSVHFEKGVIVFAKSNLIRDRLGNCLLQTGKISSAQWTAIDQRMRLGGIRFGEALVAQGWMTPQEVVRHVGSQLGRIVLSLFPLQEAEYSLEEGQPRVPPELKVRLFTGQLLLYGVRRMPANALMHSHLFQEEAQLRCVAPPPRFLEKTKLQPLEQAIVDAVREGATLAWLQQRLSVDPRDILRAVYGLFVSGILTEAEENAAVSSGSEASELEETMEDLSENTLTRFASHSSAEPAMNAESDAPTDEGSPAVSTPNLHGPAKQDNEVSGREKQLLETVELHIAVSDWRQSVPLLTELLEIAPEHPKYNALLARALGRCKGMEKHAERQFQRALGYAPESAELHYEFGRFYHVMGRAGRATQQFQEALHLDPSHKAARKAIQQMRRAQSSLGVMFKKMLR